MFRAPRNSKRSSELSATLMEILVCGEKHNVLILVFHSVIWCAWPSYKLQQCHCFIAPPANTSCWGNHDLYTCHTNSYCSFHAGRTFKKFVIYHPWIYSIILKPKLHFFYAQWPFKLVHVASPLTAAFTGIQFLIHLREHHTYSIVPLIWSLESKNSCCSAGEENIPTFQKLWCQYIPVCILILWFHIL
jgi:hypothetical protein